MRLKKNILLGNLKITLFLIIFLFLKSNHLLADNKLFGNFVEIKILDKLSSKNFTLNLNIGEEMKFNNLIVKALKCKNSEFDDNPEIIAYLQVKDVTFKDKDKVYVFKFFFVKPIDIKIRLYKFFMS